MSFVERNGVRYFTRAAAPSITAFDMIPRYLRNDEVRGITLSGTVINATVATLTRVLADGTSSSSALTPASGSFAVVRNAPLQDAEYVLDTSNAADDHNQERLPFYRWRDPTIAIAVGSQTSASGPGFTRLNIPLTITRGGSPLPVLSWTSSAGTRLPNIMHTIGNARSATINLTRGIAPGDGPVSDTIAVEAVSSLPVATVPASLTATASAALQWSGFGG